MFSIDDRRKRARVALHWSMRLFRQSGEASVESIIENLSSEGLYCITSEPFKPLERLQCEIVIPATLGVESPIVLKCRLTIRRVEHLRSAFGLGCQIEDYSLRSTIQV